MISICFFYRTFVGLIPEQISGQVPCYGVLSSLLDVSLDLLPSLQERVFV